MFTARANYTNQKRWLLCQFGPVQARMYWHPVGVPGRGLSPRVEILWSRYWDLECTVADFVRVHIPAAGSGWLRCEWREKGTPEKLSWRGYNRTVSLDPLPVVTDLLSIACNVAARKCDKGILWDWILDNWPSPFRDLCSDDPVACIRALCPMKLAGDEKETKL